MFQDQSYLHSRELNNPQNHNLLFQAQALVKLGDSSVTRLTATDVSSVYRIKIDDDIYILKSYEMHEGPNKVQEFILGLFENTVGGMKYRHNYPTKQELVSERIRQESEVLMRWKVEGIEAPKVIATDGVQDLLMTYIHGQDYKTVIANGHYKPAMKDGLLKKIREIRLKAFGKHDKSLLHNDMWLANFLWTRDDETVPIDPGLPCKPDLDFKTLDAHINLFLCYSLISPLFGFSEQTKEEYRDILQGFTSSLDRTTLKRMKEVNIPANGVELAYLRLTSWFGLNEIQYNSLKSFSVKQCQCIDDIIDRELRRK